MGGENQFRIWLISTQLWTRTTNISWSWVMAFEKYFFLFSKWLLHLWILGFLKRAPLCHWMKNWFVLLIQMICSIFIFYFPLFLDELFKRFVCRSICHRHVDKTELLLKFNSWLLSTVLQQWNWIIFSHFTKLLSGVSYNKDSCIEKFKPM